jgi:hypothetical protein
MLQNPGFLTGPLNLTVGVVHFNHFAQLIFEIVGAVALDLRSNSNSHGVTPKGSLIKGYHKKAPTPEGEAQKE